MNLKKNTKNSAVLICGIDENAKSVISVETIEGEKIKYSDIVSNFFRQSNSIFSTLLLISLAKFIS